MKSGPITSLYHSTWKSIRLHCQTYLLYVQMLFEEPLKSPLLVNTQERGSPGRSGPTAPHPWSLAGAARPTSYTQAPPGRTKPSPGHQSSG